MDLMTTFCDKYLVVPKAEDLSVRKFWKRGQNSKGGKIKELNEKSSPLPHHGFFILSLFFPFDLHKLSLTLHPYLSLLSFSSFLGQKTTPPPPKPSSLFPLHFSLIFSFFLCSAEIAQPPWDHSRENLLTGRRGKQSWKAETKTRDED